MSLWDISPERQAELYRLTDEKLASRVNAARQAFEQGISTARNRGDTEYRVITLVNENKRSLGNRGGAWSVSFDVESPDLSQSTGEVRIYSPLLKELEEWVKEQRFQTQWRQHNLSRHDQGFFTISLIVILQQME